MADVPLANRTHIGRFDGCHSHRSASKRGELDFVSRATFMDMHDRAHVPASRRSSGRFFVSTTQSCSLILIQPPKDRR
jgi:hypothetical protein